MSRTNPRTMRRRSFPWTLRIGSERTPTGGTLHRHSPLIGHRRRPFSTALVALVAVLLLPSTVGAERAPREQSIGDLKAKAAQIAAELDALDQKTSQLDETFNGADIELGKLNDQLGATKSQVDAARASFDANRQAARQYAIDAFVGTSDNSTGVFGSGDPESDGRRDAYLSALHGNREQIIESVTASRKDLADRQSSLASAKSTIDAKMAQLARDKRDLSDTIARRQQLLDSINGDLATAVQAEQARLAAEAAARAEAEARAAAARAAAGRHTVAVVTELQSTNGGPVSIRTVAASDAAAADASAASPPPPDAPVAVRVAMAQQGKPYRWAAAGPDSFDCSGLVMFAYAQAGVSLPHSSAAMRARTQRISADQLQPGDLVFGGSPVHHVGIYIGNGQMVHAPHSGTDVQVSSMYGTSSPVSFGRL